MVQLSLNRLANEDIKQLSLEGTNLIFVINHSDFPKKIMFGGRVLQQRVSIPIGTYCNLLLADLFLYSHEACIIQEIVQNSKKKRARSLIPRSAI